MASRVDRMLHAYKSMVDAMGRMLGFEYDKDDALSRRRVDIQLRKRFRTKHPLLTTKAADEIADMTDADAAQGRAISAIEEITGRRDFS